MREVGKEVAALERTERSRDAAPVEAPALELPAAHAPPEGLSPAPASSASAILRNAGWLIVGEAAYRGSRFVLTILLARYLGVAEFGRWSFAIALAALLAIVADFGLSTVTVRDVAADRGGMRRYAGNMVAVKVPLSLATLALIAVLGVAFGSDREETGLIYLLGLSVVLVSYSELFYAVFRAHERMHFEACAKAVLGASLLALGGALIWRSAPLLWFGMAYIITAALSVVLAGAVLFQRFGGFELRIDLDSWKTALRTSFPIFLATAAFVAYFRIDVVMLDQMKGDREVGLYSAAYNFVYPTAFLPILFVAALFPSLSRLARQRWELRETYLRVTLILLVYAIAVPAVIIGTRDALYLGLFGGQYKDSVSVLPVLVGAACLYYFSHFNYFVLYAQRRDRTVLTVTVASVAVNVALNLVLIPRFGMHGAAVGTLLTEVFVLGMLLAEVRDVSGVLFEQLLRVAATTRPALTRARGRHDGR